MNLLEGDSDTDLNFTINESYAKRYDKWRQGEEFQKLKDKYGEDVNSGSSSSEEEDEYGKEWTEDVEKDFFKTLSSLKEKNPKIYDRNIQFFKEKPVNNQLQKGVKQDKLYSIGHYQRDVLLENQGKFSDDEDESKSKQVLEITNVEEEKALKNSFKKIINESESDNDEEGWGALFKKKIKTVEQLKTEEEEYKLWLSGERQKLQNTEDENELKGLHDFWTNPNLDESEQFLRDYILNKRFIDKSVDNHIPSYDEIVHDSDSGLSADESTLERQEEFERKYNFRFEEPDHEFIKRFPRTLEQSMRKKDERRKKHREEVKLRKLAEKTKKCEELKRLKALKKKEIMDRIRKLQEITGNEEMSFQAKDLDNDFNPEEHDKRMAELFDENYYGTCTDVQKPEYPELDEELELENWDEWNGDKDEARELHCEDPGFNMDCDYEPEKKTEIQSDLMKSYKKGNRRRRSKFAAAVAREKPLFDPKNKTFEKYVDEYYALDYEDLIGDLPCRFKYRKVVPNDFGLSIEEILAAPDKELNSWVSVKKIMQRRPDNVELFDVQAYKKKARNSNKKQKCLPSLFDKEDSMPASTAFREGIGKNLNKNGCDRNLLENHFKNQKPKTNFIGKNSEPQNCQSNVKNKLSLKHSNHETFKNSTRNRKIIPEENSFKDKMLKMSDTRLKSYGVNPKKLKNKLKFGADK